MTVPVQSVCEIVVLIRFFGTEDGGEVILEHPTLGPKIFHIPAFYSFDDLHRDVCDFYGEDPSTWYLATKKKAVWTGKALV